MTRAGWRIKYSRRNYEQLLARLARSKCYFHLSIYWILIIDISSVTTSHCVFRFPHSHDSEHFQKYLIAQSLVDVSPILIVMAYNPTATTFDRRWILFSYNMSNMDIYIVTQIRSHKFPRWIPYIRCNGWVFFNFNASWGGRRTSTYKTAATESTA